MSFPSSLPRTSKPRIFLATQPTNQQTNSFPDQASKKVMSLFHSSKINRKKMIIFDKDGTLVSNVVLIGRLVSWLKKGRLKVGFCLQKMVEANYVLCRSLLNHSRRVRPNVYPYCFVKIAAVAWRCYIVAICTSFGKLPLKEITPLDIKVNYERN